MAEKKERDPPEELPKELTVQALSEWLYKNWGVVLIVILLIVLIIIVVWRTGKPSRERRFAYVY